MSYGNGFWKTIIKPECWVVAKRGRPVDDETFWYIDAVEEAMRFGWIDSTTKKMDNGVADTKISTIEEREVYGLN